MQSKKILFVINDVSNAGGTERVTTHIANLLSEQGFSVCIASLHQSKLTPFFNINANIKTVSLFQQPISLFKQLISIAFKIRKLAKSYEFVVFSDTQLGLVSWLSSLTLNSKIILWEHFNSSIVTRFGSRWFGRHLAAWFSDLIIVLTEQDKECWQKKYTVRCNITVIPNPSAIPLRSEPRTEFNHRKVISIGRYTDQKGFDLLLTSWRLLPEELRATWHLDIVGPNGSAKPLLHKKLTELGLANVALKEATNNMVALYDLADIYVMSSRYEGFGLTLIEAMSRALPVIAFDCLMGPGEIINQKHGVLVSPENTEQLAIALKNLMEDQNKLIELSKTALDRAACYTPDNIVKQWLEILAKLTSKTVGNI
jgi:glycosyltransferase involved in cell wall biosynthesis